MTTSDLMPRQTTVPRLEKEKANSRSVDKEPDQALSMARKKKSSQSPHAASPNSPNRDFCHRNEVSSSHNSKQQQAAASILATTRSLSFDLPPPGGREGKDTASHHPPRTETTDRGERPEEKTKGKALSDAGKARRRGRGKQI
ncbi:predicted protein [Arabidopsis lyrata subsp. lyrata]|uniref:Predicted protein n=1 Tax=Arabidopsis lyrata subsp. lyrata TaxID=81972 RepID=D7KY14_ARALL|nr:predicted protein [Arabidopsis lyrata subsp. lyrata]